MKQWQYKIFDLVFLNEEHTNIDQEMENIGNEGWEVYFIEKVVEGEWPYIYYLYNIWCKKERINV